VEGVVRNGEKYLKVYMNSRSIRRSPMWFIEVLNTVEKDGITI